VNISNRSVRNEYFVMVVEYFTLSSYKKIAGSEEPAILNLYLSFFYLAIEKTSILK
jgi:hypothetical protein